MQDIVLPRENDVLFGRGGGTNHHPGNRRWRQLVEDRKHEYARQSRLEKPMVSQHIIDRWRAQVPAGRFLKKNRTTGFWNDVGDKKAREKTSQALREKSSSSGSHNNNNNNNNNNTDEDDAMVQSSYLASLPSLSSLLSVAVESLPSLSSLRSVGVETAVPHHNQKRPSEDNMAALSTTTVPTSATVGAVPNHRRASAAFKRRRKRMTSNENETDETKPHAVKRPVYKNSCSNGRCFQKKNTTTGFWNDVGDTKAREKTSQALREKGSSNGGAVIPAAVPPRRASTAFKRSTSNENESYETKPRAVKRPVYKNSDDIDSSNENESYDTKPRAVKRPASSEQDEGSDNVDTTTLTLLSLNHYKNNYDIDSTRHGSNQAVDPIQFSILTSFTSDGLNRFSHDTKKFCGIDATRQNNDVLTSLALFRNDDNDDNKNKDDADGGVGLNASRERFSSFTSDMYEELLHLDDPITSTALETNHINDGDAISIPSPIPLSVPFAQTERLTTEDALEVMMIDDFGRNDDASSCNSLEILRDVLEDEQNTAVDDDYNNFLESLIAADLDTGIHNNINTRTSKIDNTFRRSSTDCVSNETLMTYAEHANALTTYNTADDWTQGIAVEFIPKQQTSSIPHYSTSSGGCIKGGTMPPTSTGISSERRLLLHERDHVFPWLMHRILDDAASKGFEDIISWVSTNNGFKVHNKAVFASKIIPEYFDPPIKYKSFQRSVNMWGLKRVDRDDCPGTEKGSYVHESFIRGNPDLCKNMKRVKIKGNGKGNGKADHNLSPEEFKPGVSANTNSATATTNIVSEKDWYELTPDQKLAAITLGWNAESWNGGRS